MDKHTINITINATPDRPGIGKTTVAHMIAQKLIAAGLPVSLTDDGHMMDTQELKQEKPVSIAQPYPELDIKITVEGFEARS